MNCTININEILKRSKLKVTKARVKVLESLSSSGEPLTVPDIQKKIGDKSINEVTIYRTIESLLKNHIIGRVDLRQDAIYYELIGSHHHHIVCENCGVLEDFEACEVERMLGPILKSSKLFSAIKDHSFELFGLCVMCAKKNHA